jgi:hypothetical protein
LRITPTGSVRVMGDAHGNVVCLAVGKMDVTALEAQRAARLIEARLGPLLESTPKALVVSSQAGRSLLVDARAERRCDCGRRALIGAPRALRLRERFRERYGAAGAAESEFQSPGIVLERYGARRFGTAFPAEVKARLWGRKRTRSS